MKDGEIRFIPIPITDKEMPLEVWYQLWEWYSTEEGNMKEIEVVEVDYLNRNITNRKFIQNNIDWIKEQIFKINKEDETTN